MSTCKILRPAIPFQTGIPGGICAGKMIQIKGRVPIGAVRFRVDLNADYHNDADPVLHIGVRFDQNCVVRNHSENGTWGPEEYRGPFPFTKGMEFKMLIVAEGDKYRIAVNDSHCWDFRHRLPMDRIKSIAVWGSVDIYEIEFIG